MVYLDKSTVQIPTRLSVPFTYKPTRPVTTISNLKPSGETEYGATQIPTSFVCSISNRRGSELGLAALI